MRFLIDECTGPAVAGWLREQGHDVYSVYEQARGMDDNHIVEKGVILLRLDDERAKSKIGVIQRLLENYSDRLRDNFLVATEQRVRIAKK
jgi:uncharacterized protein with PIN domain